MAQPATIPVPGAEPDSIKVMAADVGKGLSGFPKELPCRYLYDEVGGELFDAITRLPEYYPTRAERAVLTARAASAAFGVGLRTQTSHGVRALTATSRLEPDMERAAISGRRTSPNPGSKTPAAIGIAIAL